MKAMRSVWVIIPAAGSGQRFGGSVPKQYQLLCGKPLLEHTISKWLSVDTVSKVVVAIAEDDGWFESLSVASDERVQTVVGGEERCHSVLNALEFVSQYVGDSDTVLVHDAARPCFSIQQVGAMIEQWSTHEAGAIMAVPVADTLKRSGQEGAQSHILETVDRSEIWQAQTPQMFPPGLLLTALKKALSAGFLVTDEASAMEYAGYRPMLFPGSPFNLKITRKHDLLLAEQILKEHLDE